MERNVCHSDDLSNSRKPDLNLQPPNQKTLNSEGVEESTTQSAHSDRYYKLDEGKDKLAIIFKNKKFESHLKISTVSDGADADSDKMKACLGGKGFKVEIKEDQTKQEIETAIKEISKKSSSDVSCIVVVVMTHGGEEGILAARDGVYSKDDLFTDFLTEDTKLAGVPKLFFILACRGGKNDLGVKLVEYDGDEEIQTLSTRVDILTMYSTVEGFASYLQPTRGSRFIRELSKQLSDKSGEWDLIQLLTFVNGEVARHSAFVDPGIYCKEMSQITSTLTKLLKFPRE